MDDQELANEISRMVAEINVLLADAASRQLLVEVGATDGYFLDRMKGPKLQIEPPKLHVFSIARALTLAPEGI